MQIGYHTITWGGVTGAPLGVTSVKDLCYLSGAPVEAALEEIAAAGYRTAELFDGNLLQFEQAPGELSSALDRLGMKVVSVYTGGNFIFEEILGEELAKIDRVIRLAAGLGVGQLVVGGGALRSTGVRPQDYDRLAAALDRVAEAARRAGMTASYHPHLGTLAAAPEEIDRVLSRSGIAFCPDTAHLAAGGGDPAELIRRYGDRVAHVHLKDLTTQPLTFQPLGHGQVDFAAVLAALKDLGYRGQAIVELDSYPGRPAEAADISREYLRRHGW